MGSLDDLSRLKQKAERLRQERDRAEGRLEESLKRLKTEFEVASLEEAKALLLKLEQEETNARKLFESVLAAFET